MNVLALAVSVAVTLGAADAQFSSAKPVWPEGRETEINLFVGFRGVFEAPQDKPVELRLTASCIYRAWVNGQFLAHGPARACHDYYRVDNWDLAPLLKPGKNVVAIEVAGYNTNSYYLLDQPSFLQAEVISEGTVLASTGGAGSPFEAAILTERLQKVQRYSFQRTLIEQYNLTPECGAWRSDPAAPFKATACAPVSAKKLLPRRIPYPRFAKRPALWHVAEGKLETGLPVDSPMRPRYITGIGTDQKGYPENELVSHPMVEMQGVKNIDVKELNRPIAPGETFALPEKTFHTLDLGTNLTGFIGLHVTCKKAARLQITFDEVLSGTDVNWQRLGCADILTWDLAPGTYALESFEPYTLRALKLMTVKGDCVVDDVYLREYVYPDVWEAQFASSDPRLARLFDAGRETFRQNAVDVFMDCPSRERAGWLCDSFFTARTGQVLAGDALLEHNFVENFLLPPKFEHLPDGMLPMCYPSDHYNGNFIPNWAMWFVVQLEEYLARSGDRATVDALKPRVLALFKYFEPFENQDGLLEKLERWVFVEWSAANNFVQDVNYPSNMLYSGALSAAAHMYSMPGLEAKAKTIRETIIKQSYDGAFFVDNAVRKEGKLEVTRNRSEVCQYFAFFFGLASPETHPELWKNLQSKFGPDRKETKAFSEIHMANSFIGNMLRFELLSQYGYGQQILDESIGYLMYMAERTGTLWENVHDGASCNHGFASHICYTLYRDILGVYSVDPVAKTVQLRFTPLSLDWCEGRIPVSGGAIDLSWKKDGNTLRYRLDPPAGYKVAVDNRSGMELVREH